MLRNLKATYRNLPALRTWLSLVFSVFVSAFLLSALLCLAYGGMIPIYWAIPISLIVTLVMILPAFCIGIPIYMYLKARSALRPPTYIQLGAAVSFVPGFILLQFVDFGPDGYIVLPVYLLFLAGGAIAGFVFFLVDRGDG